MRYLIIFLIVASQVSCKKDIDPEPVLLVEAASFLNTSYGSRAPTDNGYLSALKPQCQYHKSYFGYPWLQLDRWQ